MNKAEEDIRMSKHVLQIKVCCHLPQALNKLRDIEKFWKFNLFFDKFSYSFKKPISKPISISMAISTLPQMSCYVE